jgi:menaquinone-dependent protoporphyrinogen oxidase
MKVLVTAASRHGATTAIAAAITKVLAERAIETVVLPPDEVGEIDDYDYDAVVLGSAVYAGRWLEPATALVKRSGDALAARPTWVFSSGPVGDPSRKLVQKMGADPVDLAEIMRRTGARDHRMFAGRLDSRNLSLPQRVGIRLVRGLVGDFRNWTEIESWASEIAEELGSPSRPEILMNQAGRFR